MRRGFGFLQLEMKGNLSFATLHSVDAHSLRILEEFRTEKPDAFGIRLMFVSKKRLHICYCIQ